MHQRSIFTNELPSGAVLLEASAGTGKTHTIAGLTSRYIQERGYRPEQFLVVTFGKQAAGELRQRIWQRLEADHKSATDPVAKAALQNALDTFDQALITTIHGFCQRALTTLGVIGDWAAGETASANLDPMIEQCAADTYLKLFAHHDHPALPWHVALRCARSACTSTLPLEPRDSIHAEYAHEVRKVFAQRRRRAGLVSFDDMTSRLRALLDDPVTAPAVAQELRRRFQVVLVDEFQDTDPDQWAIFRSAFLHAGHPLVLIGDPKQSVYGFRNADLNSYLEASEMVEQVWTLPKNWRSDEPVVRGVAELFGDVTMGDNRIRVTDLQCAHPSRITLNGHKPAGVWLRQIATQSSDTLSDVLHDLCTTTARLLRDGQLHGANGAATVRGSDIAVLVRASWVGDHVIQALNQAGIPAQWHGGISLFGTPAAQQWLTVLRALAAADRASTISAALTPLMGIELDQLTAPSSNTLADVTATIRAASVALTSGHADWARRFLGKIRLGERLAGLDDELLSDCQQLADEFATTGIINPGALATWLETRIEQAAADQTTRKASGHHDAVKVLTMHSAKGSQYPIVLIPEAGTRPYKGTDHICYIGPDNRRRLWVGEKIDKGSALEAAILEQRRAEELRLLYVALTRARHLSVVWHVAGHNSTHSALTALLARTSDELAAQYNSVPQPVTRFNPQLIDVEFITHDPTRPLTDEPAILPQPHESSPQPPIQAAVAHLSVDPHWRRTSYTGLTSDIHSGAHLLIDEPDDLELPASAPPQGMDTPASFGGLPAGAAFGTAVHEALESLDWSAEQLTASASEQAQRVAPSLGLDAHGVEALQQGLINTCTTPLGAIADGVTLSEIPIQQRLCELDFDLALGARGTPHLVTDLASVMQQHLAANDPLVEYPQQLANSLAAPRVLRGILTGSIDAVLQLADRSFLIVDYKTNRFPTGDQETLTTGHYQPSAMAQAMMQAHYPLQALLYGAALHRFLGWRLPDYEPRRHLRGAAYLFLRGMVGPHTAAVGSMTCGVFAWQPPAEIFIDASEVLGGS